MVSPLPISTKRPCGLIIKRSLEPAAKPTAIINLLVIGLIQRPGMVLPKLILDIQFNKLLNEHVEILGVLSLIEGITLKMTA
jgi:hypothetical protein